ncbi:MAG: contractile injection system tape measure protein [Fluviicola sp.]|nr:contractile injection system tape measure protein [Fluviicola sp.]
MSEQQHIIRQQVLELEFTDESDTEAIQQEVLALFNRVVLPMYDRFFSAYSNAHEIDQIARLELDLGEISLHNLERELIDKIADALDEQLERLCGAPVYDDPDELAAQLGLSQSNSQTTNLAEVKLSELTAFFEQHQPEETTTQELTSLQEQEAEAERRRNELIRFFEQQSQTDDDLLTENSEEDEWDDDEWETIEPTVIEINYQSQDDVDHDLVEPVVNETDRQEDETSQRLLSDAAEFAPVSESILLSNHNILHYFLQTGLFPWWAKNSSKSQLEQAIISLIQHRPEALKTDLQAWLTHKAMRKRLVAAFSDVYLVKLLVLLLPSDQPSNAIDHELFRILTSQSFPTERHRLVFWEALFQDVRFLQEGMNVVPESLIYAVFSQTETLEPAVVRSLVRGRLLTSVDRLFQISKMHPDWIRLEELTARFNNHPLADSWFSAFLADFNTKTQLLDSESAADAARAMDHDTESLIELLLKLQETHTTQLVANDVSVNEPENIPPIPLAIDAFSESEKLYVRNAGMIVLWPFLERYFEKNGLFVESKFIHQQAKEQASWLLQHLVFGSNYELFEPHIALNKVLVGLQPETPVHTPELITEQQQLLIEELLKAVMEHVPAWKNLSVENLRKAYLQREGALSARDGQWLLQVKRETYDVLLDKLPWPIQLIRLPWLEHLLVVEW